VPARAERGLACSGAALLLARRFAEVLAERCSR
jgi:hypothetical protein